MKTLTRYHGMIYVAVCVASEAHGRIGFVVGPIPETKIEYYLPRQRIGYVGCFTLQEACQRSGMMERNEAGAWGPL